MQNMFKRILSLALIVCMMLALVPVTAQISVNAASYTWTKVSLSEISANDTIAITMTKGTSTWALTNNNGASKAPTAQAVEVSDNTMTSASSDNIAWNISKSGNNLTIYVSGSTTNWLYSTNTNNGTRVGNNTNKTWVVDASSGYLKHNGTNRYLGVYNSSDWRSYTNTTGNTAGQSLSFWKLNDNTTPECSHDYAKAVTAPTCVTGGFTTFTCSKCNDIYVGEEKPANGHSYDAGICTTCGAKENNYSGRYYIAAKRSSGYYFYMTNSLGTANTKRYQATNSQSNQLPVEIAQPDSTMIFVLEKIADETYRIYAEGVTTSAKYLGWTSGNSGALVASNSAKEFTVKVTADGLYNIYFLNGSEMRYLSLNNNTGNDYFAFYAGTQINNLALIPVNETCNHDWENATCTAPKTCKLCNETEGTSLGHSWLDATCEYPMTCRTCSATDGEALGHNQPVYTNHGHTHSVDYPCCNTMDSVDVIHSYTNGVCVCGATETKSVVIYMMDSYGDGWGDNGIAIYENGILISTATVASGSNAEYSFEMDGTKEYEMLWVKGSWSSECSFEIVIDGETVFSATGSDCNLYANNKILYPPCPHVNCTSVVTPPTCTADGYTTYTCVKCGVSYTDDAVPTTGHSFGDDDICDVCGYDKNIIQVSIILNDSFGDGWNGNQLYIYEDGELFATLALSSGTRTYTWTGSLSRNKVYEYYWGLGNFPSECSFDIVYDGETVFSATRNDCGNYKNDQLIYPPCSHTNCDAVVTPPTCTEDGYTTSTCLKCGEVIVSDVTTATGHSFGDDTVCDSCGFDSNGIIIHMTDSYGDGWNGNAIEIYEDGVLIGTATFTSGYTQMHAVSMNEEKNYTFNCVQGYSSGECSFEIMMNGVVVYSSNRDNCNTLIGGQQVYPYYQYSGWTELGGKVYYFDVQTNKPVTGISRLPYPTTPLNGITYAPNPEDVAYAESLGVTFIDKDEAWFFIDAFGVLQQNTTGVWSVQIEDTYEYRYVVNGIIPWNPGLIYNFGEYWYFTGDAIYGGNCVSTGDVYVIRNTTDFDVVIGGIYTFGSNGYMKKYEGITEVDGALRYYENYRLMAGNGLTKVGDNYIFVRSNGELVVNRNYYIPANDCGVASGEYRFDENGFMENPVSTEKDGMYYENGAWYYYENGRLACGKGMMNIATYWHYPDGSVQAWRAFVYVRTNGQLATGEYYITNVQNEEFGLYSVGQKVQFSDDGMAYATKDGIVDGYYYENGKIIYNAGLIEFNGGWIYVRSNGKVATGTYWITNTNGAMAQGCYEFGTDGFMIVSQGLDGIVEENGAFYYYENGVKAYGAGLIQLDNGSYIYVRTNGQLAIGSYWVTNHNGLLEIAPYDFGSDGILTIN